MDAIYEIDCLFEVHDITFTQVFEVYDDSVVNTVTADIMRMGPYNVTCTPLIGIDRLANILELAGRDRERLVKNGSRLSEKYVLWFELPMDNHDISQELSFPKRDLEIFKVPGERRLYVFTCATDADDLDWNMVKLPVGDKSKILTHL
ncbi:unnamed protein product [Mytilus edulis]|uniref:Uncharacterized protein n=1 Tax=Mytilus edulis TaxID=6550 RepID=A0A8S3S0F7_MYTED|nr:unnamed protein product [Mytilus edulis]